MKSIYEKLNDVVKKHGIHSVIQVLIMIAEEESQYEKTLYPNLKNSKRFKIIEILQKAYHQMRLL